MQSSSKELPMEFWFVNIFSFYTTNSITWSIFPHLTLLGPNTRGLLKMDISKVNKMNVSKNGQNNY